MSIDWSVAPLLALILVMLVAPLLSLLRGWIRRQSSFESELESTADARRGGAPALPRPLERPRVPAEIVPPGAVGETRAVRQATPANATAVRRAGLPARAALAGLRSRRELRHSFALMAVLGPCRALDTHRPDQ